MNLMELRIPQGFAIYYNRFYDVEPISDLNEDDFLTNWTFFTQDLLQISKMELEKGSWNVPKDENRRIHIVLGWYPDSRASGEYGLAITNGKWDTLMEISSRDRFEIKQTLEKWLEKLNEDQNYLKNG